MPRARQQRSPSDKPLCLVSVRSDPARYASFEPNGIISIGSCLGEHVGFPGITLYSMTKAALIGFTKGLARDLGPRGVTVNCVEPGPIDTDMNPASGDHADGQRAALALGHYGTVDDIAAMVAHLAGNSGRFITGASILVDGGYAA